MATPEGSNQGSSRGSEDGVSSPTDRIGNQPEGTEDGWSTEDWRLWNLGLWNSGASTSPAPTVYDDEWQTGNGGRTTWWTSSTASADPWASWRDPWSTWRSEDGHEERTGGGGSDKIVAPEFNGEDDRDGIKARGYLRKVQAWKRVTRLKPAKQALVLYNSLTGKAWRDAEELDVSTLDASDGVEVFISWVKERYLDKEVVKAGKYMSDFFKNFKKLPTQDIRDFNMEFDRHIGKLREVGCMLPGACNAWWYVDKLRLDNGSELNLLASVGNTYELTKLQEAAVVQDRMNRRIWETKRQDPKKNHVYVTEVEDASDELEDMEDIELYDGEEENEEQDEETHEAFVAYQNAKAKYNNVLKARGAITPQGREEALQRAKQVVLVERKDIGTKTRSAPRTRPTALLELRPIRHTSSTTRVARLQSWRWSWIAHAAALWLEFRGSRTTSSSPRSTRSPTC